MPFPTRLQVVTDDSVHLPGLLADLCNNKAMSSKTNISMHGTNDIKHILEIEMVTAVASTTSYLDL